MAEFANYGFNKSHAAAYCVVAAHTAWLKHYYPVEFFAALLTTEMGDTDKIVKYVKDAKSHGIQVRPPHLNHSEYKFTVKGDQIFFSLGAIKGVGESAVDAIVEARNNHGAFESLEDFFNAVDLKRINKKTIECMIKAGALDGFGYNRNELLLGYPKFIERADRFKKDSELGQASLFAETQETFEKVQLEKSEDLSRAGRLAFEKEVLGFFLTDHPLNGLGRLSQTFSLLAIEELRKVEPKKDVRVLGIVSSMREILTKKGTRMAFAQFEDASSSLELVIFPDVFNKVQFTIREETPLIVVGQIQREGESQKMLVSEVHKLSDMLKRTKRVVFRLQPSMASNLSSLKQLCLANPGGTAISFDMELPDLAHRVRLDVSEPQGIEASAEFIEKAQRLFGEGDFADFDISG
jgi:DNA polymerase-3 subunit alpha